MPRLADALSDDGAAPAPLGEGARADALSDDGTHRCGGQGALGALVGRARRGRDPPASSGRAMDSDADESYKMGDKVEARFKGVHALAPAASPT